MEYLLHSMPEIKRIRGNRLYTESGRKILDLWLDDGRGILGDRENKSRTYANNAANKGLVRPYPGVYEKRYNKAVTEVWKDISVIKSFTTKANAFATAKMVCGKDPIILRPFMSFDSIPDANENMALLRLPAARTYSPYSIVVNTGSKYETVFSKFESDIVPPQFFYASARALYTLANSDRDGYNEELWARFFVKLDKWFTRTGPYIYAKCKVEKYPDLFKVALSADVLLSPEYNKPSCIPEDFSDGEINKLCKALESSELD